MRHWYGLNTQLVTGLAVGACMIGVAHAADLAPATGPIYKAPPAPVFSWTGCYVGAEGGGNWGRSQHTATDTGLDGTQTTFDLSGGIAGGTIGCNYQFSTWVIGLEDDMSWTNKQGSSNLNPPFNTNDTAQTKETWIDTLRGRFGYAWDRWFFYGTGGAAFANEQVQLCDPTVGCGSASKTVTGWTAGAGAEWAFFRAWSFKFEYLHADFGSQSFGRIFPPGGSFFATRNVTLTDDMFRVGVNYKFW
jgi:outer membrane immunogenic protein